MTAYVSLSLSQHRLCNLRGRSKGKVSADLNLDHKVGFYGKKYALTLTGVLRVIINVDLLVKKQLLAMMYI